LATGPVRSADLKLRRAQAIAHHSGAALRIARELIHRKLLGQEQVAQNNLKNSAIAEIIGDLRLRIAEAEFIDALRLIESQAAKAYWSAWRDVVVSFPRKDFPRVPDHLADIRSTCFASDGFAPTGCESSQRHVELRLRFVRGRSTARCRCAWARSGVGYFTCGYYKSRQLGRRSHGAHTAASRCVRAQLASNADVSQRVVL
jgi:hypothetical protein